MKKLLKNLIWLCIIGFLLFVQFYSVYSDKELREEAELAAKAAAQSAHMVVTVQPGHLSRWEVPVDEFKGIVNEFSLEIDNICKSSEVVNWASEKVSSSDVLVYVTGNNSVSTQNGYEENVENNVLSRYIKSLFESGVTIPQNVKIVLRANNGEPVVEVIDLNNYYSKVNI